MVRNFIVFFIFFSFSASFLPVEAENTVGNFKIYRKAYNDYRDALTKGASKEKVKDLYDRYLQAKSIYNEDLGLGKTQSFDLADEKTEKAEVQTKAAIQIGSQVGSGLPGLLLKDKKIVTKEDGLIAELYTPQAYQNPDKAINAIKVFLKKNPKSKQRQKLIYELAKAYQRLKGDIKTSAAILKKLAGTKLSILQTTPGVAPQKLPLYALKAKYQLKVLAIRQKMGQLAQTVNTRRTALATTVKSMAVTPWYNIVGVVRNGWNHLRHSRKFSKAVKAHNKYYQEAAYYIESNPLADRMTLPQVFHAIDPDKGVNYSNVRLLEENTDAWNSRWTILSNARQSIDITYFIVEDAIFGMSMLGKLLEKAAAGVEIRLMMDARGTKKLKASGLGQDFLQELKNYDNVRVRIYNPMWTVKNLLKIFGDLRTIMSSSHHKIMIVDGQYAITGGRNISPSYFVSEKDVPDVYRDTDILMEGDYICQSMCKAFEQEFETLKNFSIKRELLGNWWSRKNDLSLAAKAMDNFLLKGTLLQSQDEDIAKILNKYNEELKQYPSSYDPDFTLFPNPISAQTKVLTKNSQLDIVNEITTNLIKFIDACEKEIVIQNPYVVLTKRMRAALVRASNRGVKIIMHTNSPVSTDSLMTQAMFYGDWKDVLKDIPTMQMYTFYGKRKLHAKVFNFDSTISVIGTYNLDYMSEQINGEDIAVILSKEFSKYNRDAIFADIKNSVEYKVNVLPDGQIEVLYGPDSHPGQGYKIKMIRLLSKFRFFKPII
ncbi:phosphatidylserine/phosphatidylglycerophosphate/cardiolipin synthase family protein [Candidatus Riflebacteria bacterium]